MTTNTPEWLKLPFLEAIAYFANKIALPSETTKNLTAEYHDFAFVVSGITKADLVEDLKSLVDKAIAEGTDIETFKEESTKVLKDSGWNPKGGINSRLETILQTNVRRAYAAGRWQQATQPEIMERRPYWIWRHRDSRIPRPNHLALHNKAIRADHPFWKTAAPSCAFGCKCSFYTANERLLGRIGATILDNPPDPNTIAEKGFQRAAGSTPAGDKKQVLEDGLSRQSPEIREKVEQELKKKGVV